MSIDSYQSATGHAAGSGAPLAYPVSPGAPGTPAWPSRWVAALSGVTDVLAVAAHPDESFGLEGLLAALAASGRRVRVLCLTRGEASTLGPSDDLATVRSAELSCAAERLGVTDAVLDDWPDGSLRAENPEALAARVEAQLGDAGAVVVLEPSGITGHPDHQTASRIAAEVAARHGLLVVEWGVPDPVAAILRDELAAPISGSRPFRPCRGRHTGRPGPPVDGDRLPCQPAARQPGLGPTPGAERGHRMGTPAPRPLRGRPGPPGRPHRAAGGPRRQTLRSPGGPRPPGRLRQQRPAAPQADRWRPRRGLQRRLHARRPGEMDAGRGANPRGRLHSPHDHTSWGAAATAVGVERNRRYAGSCPDRLVQVDEQMAPPGGGYLFAEDDIHQACDATGALTVSLHLLAAGGPRARQRCHEPPHHTEQ